MKLFLDLDGVLVDFDRGVVAATGKRPHELSSREMWRALARTPDFFATLPFTRDGERLWAYCRRFRPTILTGMPHGDWAEAQKRCWVARHLGEDVPVITCLARDKACHAEPGHVLIDDRASVGEAWRAKGGTFILHRDADHSIAALHAIGFGALDSVG